MDVGSTGGAGRDIGTRERGDERREPVGIGSGSLAWKLRKKPLNRGSTKPARITTTTRDRAMIIAG